MSRTKRVSALSGIFLFRYMLKICWVTRPKTAFTHKLADLIQLDSIALVECLTANPGVTSSTLPFNCGNCFFGHSLPSTGSRRVVVKD